MTRRKLLWLAAASAFVLAVWSASAEGGFRRYVKLTRELSTLREKNLRLAQANAKLAQQIAALHDSPDAKEQAAREELGWVKPRELIFTLEGGK